MFLTRYDVSLVINNLCISSFVDNPDSANALYQLGLTTQIPMKQVYLTNRQIGNISIGKALIEFRKVVPKELSEFKKHN